MRICKTCELELPIDSFYTIKQKAGNITYRKECKNCFNNKEKNRYYYKVQRKGKYRLAYCTSCQEWKIKSQYFAFETNKCNSCVKNDLETIVEPVIEIVEEHTQQEQSPEITPSKSILDYLYKTCTKCGESKLKETGYYKSGGRVCKECTRIRERKHRHSFIQKKKETYGGSEFVKMFPNEYQDIYQKEHTFKMLEAMGWKFNTENNIWYDDKIKDKNGVFINIIPEPIIPKEKKKVLRTTFTQKLKEIRNNNIETIITLREEGHILGDIAKQYGVSRPTLTKWINEHKGNL